mmetsp:Transcript_117597/g.344333  ORF Transcript_117597/g.344333 Transcript_117597/m.344333 type:complete len:208 (-) Transcript_117597:1282-1905(-)
MGCLSSSYSFRISRACRTFLMTLTNSSRVIFPSQSRSSMAKGPSMVSAALGKGMNFRTWCTAMVSSSGESVPFRSASNSLNSCSGVIFLYSIVYQSSLKKTSALDSSLLILEKSFMKQFTTLLRRSFCLPTAIMAICRRLMSIVSFSWQEGGGCGTNAATKRWISACEGVSSNCMESTMTHSSSSQMDALPGGRRKEQTSWTCIRMS